VNEGNEKYTAPRQNFQEDIVQGFDCSLPIKLIIDSRLQSFSPCGKQEPSGINEVFKVDGYNFKKN
jgi:hypothetical protein